MRGKAEPGSREGGLICWSLLARSVVQVGSARLHGDNHQWCLVSIVGLHQILRVPFGAFICLGYVLISGFFILNELEVSIVSHGECIFAGPKVCIGW